MAVRRFRVILQQKGHDTKIPFVMELEIVCESSEVVRRANGLYPNYKCINHVLID